MPRPTPFLIPLLSLCSITCLSREAQAEDVPCPPPQEQAQASVLATPPETAVVLPSCTLHPGQEVQCPSSELIGGPILRRRKGEREPPMTGNVEIDAERVSGNVQEDTVLFQGGVDIHQGDREVKGDEIEYTRRNNSVKTEHHIEYTDPVLHVTGNRGGSYSPDQGGDFKGAEFELRQRPARGRAESMWWTPEGVLRMEGVSFTTCPATGESWKINAKTVRLDTQSKIGVAKDATIDFGGIPIFWAPELSFPLSNQRKSGFLFPMVGETSQSGALIATPFYWDIAPNMDFTLDPIYYSRRNEDVGGDFRFLTESSHGEVTWNFLPNDILYDSQYGGGHSSQRSRLIISDVTELPDRLRLTLRGENVSDSHYFEDFSQGPEGTSTAFLDRAALLSYRDEHWRIDAEAEQYQTVDPTLALEERPYERVPRVAVDGDFGWGPQDLLAYGFDSEAVRFDRNTSELTAFPAPVPGNGYYPCYGQPTAVGSGPGCLTTGWRFTVAPRAQLNIDGPGYFIHPSVAYSATQYELQNSALGTDALAPAGPHNRYAPLRELPIASLDTGIVLERSWGSDSDGRTLTLEPRLMYLYIPYRYQDNLPLFDTARPDLNPIELFRSNRYVGGDRIGDANQLTAGITSRLLDSGDGRQYLTATIGQAYYFTPPRVFLPGEATCSTATVPPSLETPLPGQCTLASHSDFIAQLQLTAWRHWSADYGLEWDPSLERPVRMYTNVQYKPKDTAVLNLSYRYELNAVDQVELSTAWPVTRSWNVFVREIYSLRTENVLTQANPTAPVIPGEIPPKPLETFIGLEYRSCCWGVRLGGRQFVNTFNTTTSASRESTGVFLEVELMGFASVGSGSDTVLMENIRGYVPPNARVPQNFIPPAFP